jgi:hypothetical protein
MSDKIDAVLGFFKLFHAFLLPLYAPIRLLPKAYPSAFHGRTVSSMCDLKLD